MVLVNRFKILQEHFLETTTVSPERISPETVANSQCVRYLSYVGNTRLTGKGGNHKNKSVNVTVSTKYMLVFMHVDHSPVSML